jgi:tetratricopeptide (TPR) repeat protein
VYGDKVFRLLLRARFLALSLAFVPVVVWGQHSPPAISRSSPAERSSGSSTERSSRTREPLSALAFEHFYNMEYDRSVQEFTLLYQRHPDDPEAINHLLNATLFRELYRIGALSSGEYANDTFINATHEGADPRVCTQIKSLVEKAFEIENQRLERDPKDVATLYARGVTKAEFATYTALVEHAWFSALRNAVSARHDHEKVLALDPGNVDAKLIVGAHNYVVGNLPWAVRSASSAVGLGGNKEKGLEYLNEAAAGSGDVSIDAKIMLVVFLRRERRFDESLQILRTLEPAYPHNLLFVVEEGNLLSAKGDEHGAEEVYRRVWQDGRKGKYSGLHYEIAAAALGDLYRSERKYAAAAAAYDEISEAPKPDPEIARRAALGAGEMYDMLEERDLALKKYEAVVALDAHSAEADIARKRMKDPYRGS